MLMFTKTTVSNVIGNLVEHGIHCLPCSYENNIDYHHNNYDVTVMSK